MKRKKLTVLILLMTFLSVNVHAVDNLMTDAVEITPSTYYNDDYSGECIRDGIVRGADFLLSQWITDYESEADLTLTWNTPVTISRAVFYDRVSETDNVASGKMTFSDGTVVEFGALTPDGTATEFTFDPVTASSVVIHITSDEDTMGVGLDEVELYTPDGANVATDASASASSVLADGTDNELNSASWYSETYTNWYGAEKAINGYAQKNLPAGAEYEWASQGEPDPTISVAWLSSKTIGTIVLYDRVNANDNIQSGIIEFANGKTIDFDTLPEDGAPYYIDVPDISTDVFTITTVTKGPNPGFAEIEVYTEHFKDGKPVVEEVAQPETPVETPPAAQPSPVTTVEAVSDVPVAAPETGDPVIILMILVAAGILGSVCCINLKKENTGEKEVFK